MAFPLRQNTGNIILWGLLKNPRGIFKKDDLGLEIAQIALPAALALTADPIASLINTAFIGHIEEDALGSSRVEYQEIEIVETSIGSDVEKEELIPKTEMSGGGHKKRHISSASLALIVGGALGLTETLILICAAKPMLSYMAVRSLRIILYSKLILLFIKQQFLESIVCKTYLSTSFSLASVIFIVSNFSSIFISKILVGFSYVHTSTTVLNFEITRCSCVLSLVGNAGCFPRI